jgi:hypothetical protein
VAQERELATSWQRQLYSPQRQADVVARRIVAMPKVRFFRPKHNPLDILEVNQFNKFGRVWQVNIEAEPGT